MPVSKIALMPCRTEADVTLEAIAFLPIMSNRLIQKGFIVH